MKATGMRMTRRSSVVPTLSTEGGRRRWLVWAAAAVLLCALPAAAQSIKDYKDTYGKKKDDHTRSVTGLVLGLDEKPVSGAVVQLKNTKTLQIRSYITQDNGSYSFYELSSDVDYELRAFDNRHGASSPTKSLSSFDTRKQAILDLKLTKK
jgi:hypothetical protein